MRSRASVPMAENMSANRATWEEWGLVIFRQYRKYRSMSRVFHARKDLKPATLAVVVSEECNIGRPTAGLYAAGRSFCTRL